MKKISEINFLDKMPPGLDIKMNAVECNLCGKQTSSLINGKPHYPCPDCESNEIDSKVQKKIGKIAVLTQLDDKLRTVKFTDYEITTRDQEFAYNTAIKFVSEIETQPWLVMYGNTLTGKTMLKNCILGKLIEKEKDFNSISAIQIHNEWKEISKGYSRQTFDEYIGELLSHGILFVDNIGKIEKTMEMKQFMSRLVEIAFKENKSIVFITHHNLVSSETLCLQDFVGLDRFKGKSMYMKFFWASYKKVKKK